MLKQQKLSRNNLLFYLSAFWLPVLIMIVILATQDIYPGSERTILASDGFHQYVIFATGLRNILHGNDSLFYTFTSGLGLNFYALISYYLGSLFSPLYYFFKLEQMADAVYYITLLKFGCIGLSGAFSFKRLFTTVSRPLILALSTHFSLMSFAISQLEINTWLDVFILAPLIILGLHRLLYQKRTLLYYISLTCLFIQNYYFGYMMALFLLLYSLVQLLRIIGWKTKVLAFCRFTLVSLLSASTSAIMLVPTLLDLTTHGEKFTSLSTLFTDNTNSLDLFTKSMVGVYDTTKFGSIPMIYVGLLPLVLSIVFFTLKTVRWYIRLAYLLLFGFLICSFYIQPLDLFWQGMHAPNMFLHRYAWIFSLLLILLAGETLTYLDKIAIKQLSVPFTILLLGFGLTWVDRKSYAYLDDTSWVYSLAFLVAYAILLISYQKKQLPQKLFYGAILFFCLFEMSLNSYSVVNGLGNEWVFPTREGYTKHMQDIEELVSQTKKGSKSFFRTEQLEPQTGNDSIKYNYNGISQFSSIRNTASSSTLDRLGFKSEGTNLNLRYQNNTLIADSLFAITYNLSTSEINKYGFTPVTQNGAVKLYQNTNASQLAILTPEVYKNVDFTVNTLDNQSQLLNALSGQKLTYFSRVAASITDPQTQVLNNRVTASASNTGEHTASTSFTLNVPSNSQLYVSVPDLTFSNESKKDVTITIDGIARSYTLDNTFSFFDLGYFAEAKTITISLNFPGNDTVTFNSPTFYALDTNSYQEAINSINERDIRVQTRDNKVLAHYSSPQKASLFFTIPYDNGWTARVNGKIIPIRQADKGFMVVDVPAGDGEVALTFIPNGLRMGATISGVSVVLFTLFTLVTNAYRHRIAKKHPL